MSLLTVQRLSKSFGGLTAVDNVSFSVEEGEIVGVIGANGAGKTTLFNVIAGFLQPDSGTVTFEGRDITRLAPHAIAVRGLIKTFQLVKPFHTMTIRENVLVPLLVRGLSHHKAEAAVGPLLERIGLAGLEEALPGDLPYAKRRRLEIARALAARPKALLLDEALAGLTQTELAGILETLREVQRGGVTLLLIEHVMDATMELCQRIVVLDKGRLIATGTPAEVSHNPAVIEAYLGRESAVC